MVGLSKVFDLIEFEKFFFCFYFWCSYESPGERVVGWESSPLGEWLCVFGLRGQSFKGSEGWFFYRGCKAVAGVMTGW